MSDAFDPYYIWLGIPPEEQPPHHYRLLGVTLFENNREVIEAAANRQMAYIQEISAGDDHIDQAQKIMGQLSKARVCLLNSEKKEAYDTELRASFDTLDQASATSQQSKSVSPVKSQDVDPLMPPSLDTPLDQAESHTSKPRVDASAKEQKRSTPKTQTRSRSIFVVIGLPIIIFCVFFLLFKPSDNDEEETAARQLEESPEVATPQTQLPPDRQRTPPQPSGTTQNNQQLAQAYIDDQKLIPSTKDPQKLEHRNHAAYRKNRTKTYSADPKELKAQASEISNERDELTRTYEELNQDTVLSGHLRSSGQRLTTSIEVEPLPDVVAAWNVFDKLVNEYKLEQNEHLSWQPSENANALRQAEKNLTTPNLTKEKIDTYQADRKKWQTTLEKLTAATQNTLKLLGFTLAPVPSQHEIVAAWLQLEKSQLILDEENNVWTLPLPDTLSASIAAMKKTPEAIAPQSRSELDQPLTAAIENDPQFKNALAVRVDALLKERENIYSQNVGGRLPPPLKERFDEIYVTLPAKYLPKFPNWPKKPELWKAEKEQVLKDLIRMNPAFLADKNKAMKAQQKQNIKDEKKAKEQAVAERKNKYQEQINAYFDEYQKWGGALGQSNQKELKEHAKILGHELNLPEDSAGQTLIDNNILIFNESNEYRTLFDEAIESNIDALFDKQTGIAQLRKMKSKLKIKKNPLNAFIAQMNAAYEQNPNPRAKDKIKEKIFGAEDLKLKLSNLDVIYRRARSLQEKRSVLNQDERIQSFVKEKNHKDSDNENDFISKLDAYRKFSDVIWNGK